MAELLEFSWSLEVLGAGPRFGVLRSATNGFDHPTSLESPWTTEKKMAAGTYRYLIPYTFVIRV